MQAFTVYPGTYVLAMPNLGNFLEGDFKSLSGVSSVNIEPNPLMAIFDAKSKVTTLITNVYGRIAFTTLLARQLILLK